MSSLEIRKIESNGLIDYEYMRPVNNEEVPSSVITLQSGGDSAAYK